MRFLQYIFSVVLAMCGVGISLRSEECLEAGYSIGREVQEKDLKALQEYIKTRRAIINQEKGENLSISGDIRGEWYNMHTKTDGKYQRGWKSRKLYPNSLTNRLAPPVSHKKYRQFSFQQRAEYREGRDEILPPFATNEFDVEANIVFDYASEHGWGTVRLQLIDDAGVVIPDNKVMRTDDRRIMYGSGVLDNLSLRKCFAGYNVWEEGVSRFDVEIGRRRLYDSFDSKVEFWSYFDSVLARFTTSYQGIMDLKVKAAAFVVDYTVNHYGYVGEVDLFDLFGRGIDLKYSLIDWNTLHRPNRFGCHHTLGTRFCNSQVLINYNLNPDVVGLKTCFYGAYLYNHAARATSWTYHMKAADAYYVGGRIGEAIRKGDYSVEIFYQWVKAQAVPEWDVSPSSRDSPRVISLYNRHSGGGANFRGLTVEGFYSLSDNWTLSAEYDLIREMQRRIGGPHRFYEFYFTAIFSF